MNNVVDGTCSQGVALIAVSYSWFFAGRAQHGGLLGSGLWNMTPLGSAAAMPSERAGAAVATRGSDRNRATCHVPRRVVRLPPPLDAVYPGFVAHFAIVQEIRPCRATVSKKARHASRGS